LVLGNALPTHTVADFQWLGHQAGFCPTVNGCAIAVKAPGQIVRTDEQPLGFVDVYVYVPIQGSVRRRVPSSLGEASVSHPNFIDI
jgi:hypothetical protein